MGDRVIVFSTAEKRTVFVRTPISRGRNDREDFFSTLFSAFSVVLL